ncbi:MULTISPECIES: cellulose binding domain-containing protein [unclassified Streptomyces]|uniref:cellulose binding domain-containing protein n=1 Tax=unclassified Streptomyces TaxID=2593676 RepID=UPI001660275C|nr:MULTISPECIES: cellulose binding domain-containing protein [unclassified Streptomyces]MBD0710906.1 hydrolase [Streptomyces sp. CBMA291]MBD0717325.1 hydrolase [Streptomyces sp. CBMA370]
MRRTPHRRLRAAVVGVLATGLAALGLGALPATASAAEPALSVQYRTGITEAVAGQSAPWLTVRNTGSVPVRLADVKLRYYFSADTASAAYRFACDWAVRGCANVTGTFGTLSPGTATADRYLEIGFTEGAGSLVPGASSGDLQLRFNRSDWSQLRQSDDHSFSPDRTSYADWTKVTAHHAGVTVWGSVPGGPVEPPPARALFDDFSYTSHDDPRLGAHGWMVRSWGGGPGVPGATWAPGNVSFGTDDGASVMKLRTETSGTAATTRQAEISTTTMKFRKGTYASRIKFSDAPVSGPDGDHVIQTFFTINDLKAPMADDYAEYDFEYLPNGGWGETGSTLFTTSWDTYDSTGVEPPVNTHTADRASYAGWHDLAVTIDDSDIRYYVDGRLFATHGAAYLPERGMLIAFNQWLTDLAGQPDTTTARVYEQEVDYVLHVQDQVLTPAQIADRVAAYRAAGRTFEDTVPAA